MTDRIPQPTIRLAEVAMALDAIPRKHRRQLVVALTRLADDHGWDEEIRGFCIVLSGFLMDLDSGTVLREELDQLDQFTVTDGSLAWLVKTDTPEDPP